MLKNNRSLSNLLNNKDKFVPEPQFVYQSIDEIDSKFLKFCQ